jgi:hypothetical protein
MKTVLSDRSTAHVEIGATQFSTHATTINGLGSLELKQSESTSLTFTASRSNVEESLLSAAGVRPATGPYAGKLVGEVMDNRGVVALRHAFTPRFDVNASGGAGLRTGNSIESDFFKILDGSAGYNLISRPEEASLSLLRVSYAVDYIGFAKNLFGYGGASLLGQDGQPIPPNALGSDGMSTSPSPDTAGTGGYFSPSMFLNDGARVEVQGRANRSVELRASGFIGSQRYTGTSPHAAEGISGTAIVRLNQRLSVPVTYGWDNFGPFRQDSLLVRLVAKF